MLNAITSKRRRSVGRKLGLALAALQFLRLGAQAQNVVAGPFHLTVGFTTGFEYTDNVNSSEDKPKSDIKLTLGPVVSGAITLPITLRGGEKLQLQTGFSYRYEISLENGGQQSFSSPVTASLVLPIEFDNWTITASDIFTLSNDPLERTVAVSESNSKQYSNTAGINVTRNFGRAALTVGAQRQDQIAPDLPDLEETRYQASITPAFFFRDNYSIFWRNTVGAVQPQAPTRQDSTGWSSEVGVSGQITPYLGGLVSVGFAHSHLSPKKTGPGTTGIFGGIFNPDITPADNVDGISSTIQLNYSHPLRPNTAYSISFFRSPGVTAVLNDSNIQAIMGVNFGIAHRLSRTVTIAPIINWTHAEDVGNKGSGEVTDLISISVTAGRAFTRNLSGNITYRFQSRSSNLPTGTYDVNRVNGSLTYTF